MSKPIGTFTNSFKGLHDKLKTQFESNDFTHLKRHDIDF